MMQIFIKLYLYKINFPINKWREIANIFNIKYVLLL